MTYNGTREQKKTTIIQQLSRVEVLLYVITPVQQFL